MAVQQNQPVVYTNFDKLNLYTEIEGSNPPANARLIWGARNGNPRITVFYGNSDGRKNIPAGFDQISFMKLISNIKSMLDEGKEDKRMVRNFIRNKETKNLDVMSELWYGVNNEGCLWLAVTSSNHPKIMFKVKASDWHSFINNEGKPEDSVKLNLQYSKMYIELVEMTFERFIVNNNVSNSALGMEAVNPAELVTQEVSTTGVNDLSMDVFD